MLHKSNKVSSYCKKWALTVNNEKSKCMICSPNYQKNNEDSIYYNGCKLKNVEKFTYLGITLNSKGNFKTAIKDRMTKANRAIFKIKQALSTSGSCSSPRVSMRIFEHQIVPILTYGSVLWGLPTQSNYLYIEGIKENENINSKLKTCLDTKNVKSAKRIGRKKQGLDRRILIELDNFDYKLYVHNNISTLSNCTSINVDIDFESV